MHTSEVWLDIEGRFGSYMISSYGRVKSTARIKQCGNAGLRYCPESIMCISKDRKGYDTVILSEGGRKTIKVHRLVAYAFIPNPLGKPHVNHKDGNKSNNHVSNLEWVTPCENVRHAISTGLLAYKKGKDHYKTVKIISVDPDGGIETFWGQKSASEKLGLHQATISRVLNGKLKSTKGYKFYHALNQKP
jgi:hypothetical protein